jgi:hypothetical protein
VLEEFNKMISGDGAIQILKNNLEKDKKYCYYSTRKLIGANIDKFDKRSLKSMNNLIRDLVAFRDVKSLISMRLKDESK